MKDKELLNDMHRLLSNADSNNLKWIISKLSENTINKINAYGKDIITSASLKGTLKFWLNFLQRMLYIN